MKKPTTKLNQEQPFLSSPAGFIVGALGLWVITYLLVSMAIHTGNLWHYTAAIVCVIWGGQRFAGGIRLYYGKHQTRRTR